MAVTVRPSTLARTLRTELDALMASHYCDGCEDSEHSEYLGTVTGMDPCGRYHHVLSPNRLTRACAAYWRALDEAADSLGAWVMAGEGDGNDMYVGWPRVNPITDHD